MLRRRIFRCREGNAAGLTLLAATLGLTACGASGTSIGRDCIHLWNARSNQVRQGMVAGRFPVASVAKWRAQPAGGNVAGDAADGCGFLFHTSSRYLSISAQTDGDAVRWGVPPTIRGAWSRRQQAAVHDNVSVDASGLLRP
jgi:hypothetical protein